MMAKKKEPAYGAPRKVDPDTAQLEELWRCAGHVQWMGDKIAEWDLDPSDPLEPEQSVWLHQYQSERDRLAKIAKQVVDTGLAQRQMALAEQQAELIAGALETIFLGLQLTAEQRNRIPDVVPGVLAELTGNQADYQHRTDFGRQPSVLAELERGESS